MGRRTPQEEKIVCFVFPLRHNEGFLQANFPASIFASVWPDLSPPPFFLALVTAVFPGRFRHFDPLISLLPLTEDGPPLALADFLRPDERHHWQSFASGKRQREWLAGRICAYDCARRLLTAKCLAETAQPSGRDWWLANSEDGRPYWQGKVPEVLRGTDISISHGGGYALAIIAPPSVGADAELCAPKVERVAAQFAHPEEEQTMARLALKENRLARLTLLWSAKESLRKAAAALPAFLAMRLIDGNRLEHGWRLTLAWEAGKKATVAATLHDDHAFAFCLMEK
jgi:4'-phosphopantetheinyl transferase EntD